MNHGWTTQGGALFDGARMLPFERRCLILPQTRLTTVVLLNLPPWKVEERE